ncbi:GNAT family N-acetyltransferase [bacterium]|nr:GNAT family N-acetyltransferase [bacterium]
MNPTFRFAKKEDSKLILSFIKELASYEKMLDEVTATKELIEEWIFEKKKAEVLFILENDKEIGFAVFFNNFSTFLGKAGIYLEDLYIKEEYRHKGYGKMTIKELSKIAIERGYGRLEWWCLNWNKPSINFYLSLGAKAMSDWTVYRITEDKFTKLLDK